MKLVPLVFVALFAVSLAGLGVACGPEKAYCYDEHTTCEQAVRDKMKREADEKAAEEMRRDASMGDVGATVLDH